MPGLTEFGETKPVWDVMRAVVRERRDLPGFNISLALLDPGEVMLLVANLQLALRHPQNVRHTARFARETIAKFTKVFDSAGWAAHVELIAMGAQA